MSRKNSKQKGNKFEREVAKIFAEHFGGEWRRVPQSGAITGGFNRAKNVDLREDAKEILSSDIITPEGFPFNIECKFYEDEPKFHQIINGESKKLDEWIEQADADSEFVDREPLIIFKINRKGTYVCINKHINIYIAFEKNPYLVYGNKIILTLDNFLNNIDLK